MPAPARLRVTGGGRRNPVMMAMIAAGCDCPVLPVEEAGLGVTDTVMSYVHLQYPDWAERAGMSNAAMAALQRAMLKAPPAAKAAFAIEPHEDGTIDFHWDVVAVRAQKR